MRPNISRALAGAMLLISAPLAAQSFPAVPPAPMPVKAAQFPPFQEATLSNGMRLLVVENKKLPVLSVQLAFPAGSAYDPSGKTGVADAVAALLTKGAGKRTAEEFAEAIEGIGGSIGAGADADFLTVNGSFLSPDAEFALGLLADAVVRPSFLDKEVELLRTQTLSALQLEQSQPEAIAARFFAKGLYGEHPYGRRATPETVKAITRDDLLAFHKSRLRPSGALLVFAGDISLAKAKALAEKVFAGYTGAPSAVAAFKAPPVRNATEILLVHRPGSVQSNILVGNLTWKPNDANAYGAAIANQVLGAGANSRLFLILREAKGWTYGAYSSFNRFKETGYFQASAEVRTEVTDSSLTEMLAQAKRIGTEPIPTKEFDDAKSAVVGHFPLEVETAAQVAGQVARARLLGLPNDYVATYRQKLSAVTAKQATSSAAAGVKRDAALILVVGDGAKIYEKLKAIAPVKIVGVEGEPLTPADFVAKAVALDVDPSKLTAQTDSFTVLLNGANAIGSQVAKLEKTSNGWSYSEKLSIAMAGVQQATTVTFTPALAMLEVHQTGTQGGQAAKIDVVYAGGRAKGKATTPSQTGPKTVDVDTDMPTGAIDDNALTALLPLFKWSAGAKIPVTVLQSGKGTLAKVTLSVVGEEKVKVPAGEFEAWKVEFTGLDQPVTMFVAKGTGKLIKIAMSGMPLTIELAK